MADGGNVTQYTCYGGTNQKWKLSTEENTSPPANYFYTADQGEADFVGNTADYYFERIEGYIYSTDEPGTSPLHRLFHPRPDHVMTSGAETNRMIATGYSDDGVKGYILTEAAVGQSHYSSGVTGRPVSAARDRAFSLFVSRAAAAPRPETVGPARRPQHHPCLHNRARTDCVHSGIDSTTQDPR